MQHENTWKMTKMTSFIIGNKIPWKYGPSNITSKFSEKRQKQILFDPKAHETFQGWNHVCISIKVSKTLEMAKQGEIAVIVEKDIDLLVPLTAQSSNVKNAFPLKSGKGETP